MFAVYNDCVVGLLVLGGFWILVFGVCLVCLVFEMIVWWFLFDCVYGSVD